MLAAGLTDDLQLASPCALDFLSVWWLRCRSGRSPENQVEAVSSLQIALAVTQLNLGYSHKPTSLDGSNVSVTLLDGIV